MLRKLILLKQIVGAPSHLASLCRSFRSIFWVDSNCFAISVSPKACPSFAPRIALSLGCFATSAVRSIDFLRKSGGDKISPSVSFGNFTPSFYRRLFFLFHIAFGDGPTSQAGQRPACEVGTCLSKISLRLILPSARRKGFAFSLFRSSLRSSLILRSLAAFGSSLSPFLFFVRTTRRFAACHDFV